MNPTRKIQLFSLLCACLLWLAGCSQKPEPQPETPAPPVSPVQPEEPTPPENNGVAIENDLSAGQEQSDQGKTLLRWSLSIPQALLDGEPMMNIGNYYDNYKEKRLLSLQEELLPMARQRLEDGVLLGAFDVEEDFAVVRNQGNVLSIRRSCRQYSGGAHEAVEEKAETCSRWPTCCPALRTPGPWFWNKPPFWPRNKRRSNRINSMKTTRRPWNRLGSRRIFT